MAFRDQKRALQERADALARELEEVRRQRDELEEEVDEKEELEARVRELEKELEKLRPEKRQKDEKDEKDEDDEKRGGGSGFLKSNQSAVIISAVICRSCVRRLPIRCLRRGHPRLPPDRHRRRAHHRRGFTPLEPHFDLRLDQPHDVELRAEGPAPVVVLVLHQNGSFECDSGQGHVRGMWRAGLHKVWLGVLGTDQESRFTLDVRASEPSIQPWVPER